MACPNLYLRLNVVFDEGEEVGEDGGGDGLLDAVVFLHISGDGLLHEMVETGIAFHLRFWSILPGFLQIKRWRHLPVLLSIDDQRGNPEVLHVVGRIILQEIVHPCH